MERVIKKLLFCFAFLFLVNDKASAQVEIRFIDEQGYPTFFDRDGDTIPIIHQEWLGRNDARIFTYDMRLTYKRPKGFKEKFNPECFRNNRMLWAAFFTSASARLQAKDNEFISFLKILPIEIAEDFDRMRSIYNNFQKYLQYIQGLRNSWRWWGDRDDFQLDWRESAYFFSQEDTRIKFNADTAAFFTLTLPSEYYYLGKYRYIDVFMLQRNGRGFINFISFYTEKAKQNIDWYRRRLWGSLRYED